MSSRPSLAHSAGQAGPSPDAPAGPAGALLIRITGHDRPGLTYALASILARYDARILDVGQAVIHDGLALGILIEMTETLRTSAILTDLLLEAHRLGVEVKFSASSSDEYGEWVNAQARRRFIITVLGPAITAAHIAQLSGVMSANGLNIDRIDRLSSRTPLDRDASTQRFCVEFTAAAAAPFEVNEDRVRTALAAITESGEVDVAFQHDSIFARQSISSMGLDGILYLIGVRDRDIGQGRASALTTQTTARRSSA